MFFFSYHRVCGAQHQGWQSGNEEMGRIKEKEEKGKKETTDHDRCADL